MVRVVMILLVTAVILSCSGEKKKQENTAGEESGAIQETAAQSQPREAIPEERSEFDQLMQARIVPYFDAEGTVREKVVAPGESFYIYVFGEYNKMYPMSATEFSLRLPEGMEILTEAKSDSAVLSVGSYKTDYMMTFKCAQGPKFMMMKYSCRVNKGFNGGTIVSRKGSVHQFLGFTLCDDARTMVAAQPDSALLKKE